MSTPSSTTPTAHAGQTPAWTATDAAARPRAARRARACAASLAVLTLAVYWPVCTFDFISFDDPLHVTENPNLRPVNAARIAHIWARPYAGLYIPVAYTAWAGIQAAADTLMPARHGEPNGAVLFHSANLLLHLLNTLLVFMLLTRFVPDPVAALAGALLFALHPLQAESVAWVSELRGLLSATFALGAFLLYARRDATGVERPAGTAALVLRAVLVMLCYALAVLSKPSAVSLPLAFVVTDMWLLRVAPRRALLRSLPFLLAAVLFALLTRGTQPEADVGFVTPPCARPLIAADAIGFYLRKLAAPLALALDYGRTPPAILLSDAHCAAAFAWLALIVVAAVAMRRRTHAGAVAGLFMSGLLPVLGLVPFVHQAISTTADRYAYFALLGPALGVALLAANIRRPGTPPTVQGTVPETEPAAANRTLPWVGLGMLGILTALTALQLQHWRNSERLYRHALTVNPASSRLRNNLGQWYIDQRQFDDALREVRTSITLDPFNLHARQNLGVALINTAQPRRAWACLDMLVRERPGVAGLHNLLGIAALASGHSDRAENEFRIAVGLQPSHRDATLNLANLLIDRGQARDALALLDRVLEHPARDVDLLLASGRAHGMLEQWGDAARCDAAAAALAPQGPLPRYNLANTLLRLGRVEDAVHEYRTALRLDPAWPECRANLAAALETLGRFDEACAEYAEVRRLRPAMAPMAFFREALARQRQGHPRTATELLRKALEADPEFEPARTALAAPHPK